MKSILSLLITMGWLLSAPVTQAQDAGTVSKNMQSRSVFQRSVSLHAGSGGFGYEIGQPVIPQLNLRFGTSILPVNVSTVRTLGRRTNVDMKARFLNNHLLADWQPFGRSQSVFNKFIITAGGAYFFKATGDANIMLADNYQYGQLEFGPDEVGHVYGKADWSGLAPYAGIGFTHFTITRKFNLGLNLGTFYLNSPKVKITGTNMLAGNSSNEAQVSENLKDYKWLPVFQLNFNYSY